ncbi:MAG: golgi reassembly stacking protein 2 [Amphiamblys sp. WSBS2006]|nr:MAG: golgi reassembly stacking protein 2 [Amphiamblys sp. WSBS2006]
MGNTVSNSASRRKFAFHVLKVEKKSPMETAGVCSHFDYITEMNGVPVSPENAHAFAEWAKSSVGTQMELSVYNSVLEQERTVFATPSTTWGGEGLLGCSVRLGICDSPEKIFWHVLGVEKDSPADRAGLVPAEDYIVGLATEEVLDASNLMWKIEKEENTEIEIIVFNNVTGLRAVAITPGRGWGGEGLLGCEVGNGFTHKIQPSAVSIGRLAAEKKNQAQLHESDASLENQKTPLQTPGPVEEKVTAVKEENKQNANPAEEQPAQKLELLPPVILAAQQETPPPATETPEKASPAETVSCENTGPDPTLSPEEQEKINSLFQTE